MHRNTFIFLIFLAVFAAVVAAVNVTGIAKVQQPIAEDVTPSEVPPTPTPSWLLYTSEECGISFPYPSIYTQVENPVGGALFTNPENTTETLAITCQNEIPRPPLPEDKIVNMNIGTVSATLYHDASANDGSPVDKLIFTHPKTNLDVYIAGFGGEFQRLLSTLKIF